MVSFTKELRKLFLVLFALCTMYVQNYAVCPAEILRCESFVNHGKVKVEKARRMKNRVNEDKWKELYGNEKKNSVLRD